MDNEKAMSACFFYIMEIYRKCHPSLLLNFILKTRHFKRGEYAGLSLGYSIQIM